MTAISSLAGANLLDSITRHTTPVSRSRRVLMLLTAILLLAAGDLFMTLQYATSIGFEEANPIARHVMSHGSLTLIILWKLASVVVCLGCLWMTRRTRLGELATWACLLIMIWLCFRWVEYNQQMDRAASYIHLLASPGDPNWVVLAEH